MDLVRNDGATAFMVASQAGHLGVARLLLESGADKDSVRNDGRSALMVASQKGHLEVVRLLLESGADSNLALNGGGDSSYGSISRRPS